MKWNEYAVLNAKNFARLNGIKIGDLEASLEVAPGYLSRQEKTGTMTAEFLIKLAENIGVASIDVLISKDLYQADLKALEKAKIQSKIAELQKELEQI